MKKLFTLLTLALISIGSAWGEDGVSATRTYTNSGKTCTWTNVSATVKNTTAFGADGLMFKTVEGASNGVKMGDSNASLKVYEIGDVIYVEVASASSTGSITVKANGNNANRKLKLKSNTGDADIAMSSSGVTKDFTTADITQISDKYYIELSFADNSANTGEYKLAAAEPFSVTLTSDETFPDYVEDTATPTIDTDLSTDAKDVEVNIGTTLFIEASHVTGYQWYRNTTATATVDAEHAISGATSASYAYTAPVADAGSTVYFYCVVTNDNATGDKTATSAIAQVNVGAAPTLTAVSKKVFDLAGVTATTYGTTPTIIDNIEIKGAQVDSNSKSIDGFSLTKRIKLNKDADGTNYYAKFKVDGPCVITVYGMSGKSGDTRELSMNIGGSDVASFENGGSAISKMTYVYTTDAEADVILHTTDGSGTFNVHGIVVSDITATISAYEWSTFVSDQPLVFDEVEGLEVYKVTGHDDSAITTEAIDKAVPANTPLLLKGTANQTYYIPMAGSNASTVSGNLLKAGTGAAVSSETGKTKYVLSVADGKAIFKKIGTADATVPTGKAYLEFDGTVPAHAFFLDGDATAIKNIKVGSDDNIYYDLQGRRVLYPTKGLYIVNGKKVILK